MARKNKKGTSFSGLGLAENEEKTLRAHLKDKKWSAKRYLRFLVRTDLGLEIKLKITKTK